MSMVIVGAGPNLGAAVARRFGQEGLPVGLVSRNAEKLEALAAELRGEDVTAAHAAAASTWPTAIGGRIAPGGDHEPADVAEALWRHHTGRGDLHLRVGID